MYFKIIRKQNESTRSAANPSSGKHKLQKVEITLQDCLACSGCITSAEGVLITQQSQEELLKILRENDAIKAKNDEKTTTAMNDEVRTVVFTVSQQPILSLAKRYELTPEETAQHLSGYFRHLGADYVLNTKIADDLALLEMRNEFIERYKEEEEGGHGGASHDGASSTAGAQLPMLSSSCPGWVCYAEKTHGNFILPYISTTRSPQQIMGVLVKQWLAQKLQLPPERIYHVTIMPCYDKKLEASRDDFFDEVNNSRDVDCVITSIEIEQMLQMTDRTLSSFGAQSFDWPWTADQQRPPTTEQQATFVWAHESSASGGYSDHIFKFAAKELFNEEIDKVEYKNLRNPDFREVSLEKDGVCVLKFAIANGFRNIQNLVQKLKRGKVQYHFVEVMACPSGCINGGAQIRPAAGQPVRELTLQLEELYKQLPRSVPENFETKNIYKNFFDGSHSDKAKMLLHTNYHAVEKLNTALNIKW